MGVGELGQQGSRAAEQQEGKGMWEAKGMREGKDSRSARVAEVLGQQEPCSKSP